MEQTVKLNNGVEMPRLGLGVFKAEVGNETYQAVRWALEIGYRHIDTAMAYGNEEDVGRAIKDSGVPREDIFITTKLWNERQGYESAFEAFEESRGYLGVEYIDLYLIHWPRMGKAKRIASYRAMEELLDKGKTRAIGISNFTIRHIEELLEETTIVPQVNQVEFHPLLFQEELLRYCADVGIQLEAYSPLTRASRLQDDNFVDIAKNYKKTPAQLLIRWGLQHDVVEIPKSVKKERIKENFDVFDFEISDEDMKKLDNLNENFRMSSDPTDIP